MINDGRQDSVDIIKEKADELLEAMNVSNQKKAQEILNEIKEQVDNLEGIIAVFVWIYQSGPIVEAKIMEK